MMFIIYIHFINQENILFDRVVFKVLQLYLFIRKQLFELKVKKFVEEKFFFLISISIEKRVQEPQIVEDIDILSPFGTQVHLLCPNRLASIYYTLDGSVPTRQFAHVQVNNNEKKL